MAEKEEVLDYLRNRQKSAEAEAKINGVNLWALFGALGVVVWKLFGYLNVDLLKHRGELAHALLCAEALYIFFRMRGPIGTSRTELRYSRLSITDSISPLSQFISGLVFLLAPAYSIFAIGFNFTAIYLALDGLMYLSFAAYQVLEKIRKEKPNLGKFPKPRLGPTTRGRVIFLLILSLGYVMAIGVQLFGLREIFSMPLDVLRGGALIVVAYILVLALAVTSEYGYSTWWASELETEVFIGATSPEDAVQRIELRALGIKVEDVMSRYFGEIEKKLSDFESSFPGIEAKLGEVKDIPAEFSAERASRSSAITMESLTLMENVVNELKEFTAHITSLRAGAALNPGARAAIDLIIKKNSGYLQRIQKNIRRLRELKDAAEMYNGGQVGEA